MGQKGDKHTNEAELSVNLFMEKISSIENISFKKMFGGYGIFHEGKMFGMVDSKGTCLVKTDDKTSAKYLSKGSQKHGKMPYYSIPNEIFNSEDFIGDIRESIRFSKET